MTMDAKPDAPRKSGRRLAREYAVQGIYQSLLSGNDAPAIDAHLSEDPGFSKVDRKLFRQLLNGALDNAETLRGHFSGLIDRKIDELSPVEHAILLVATYGLAHMIETPYRVVITAKSGLASKTWVAAVGPRPAAPKPAAGAAGGPATGGTAVNPNVNIDGNPEEEAKKADAANGAAGKKAGDTESLHILYLKAD